MFDDVRRAEEELIGHIRAACAALAFFRTEGPTRRLVRGAAKRHNDPGNAPDLRL